MYSLLTRFFVVVKFRNSQNFGRKILFREIRKNTLRQFEICIHDILWEISWPAYSWILTIQIIHLYTLHSMWPTMFIGQTTEFDTKFLYRKLICWINYIIILHLFLNWVVPALTFFSHYTVLVLPVAAASRCRWRLQ